MPDHPIRRPSSPERVRGEVVQHPHLEAHAAPPPPILHDDGGPVIYVTEVRRRQPPELRPAPPMALRPRLAMIAGVNLLVAFIAVASSMPLGPAVGLAVVFTIVVAAVTS